MDQTREWIRRAKEGSQEAKEKLILENTGLVWKVIKGFQGRGYEKEDLFQIGCIGLIKSVERFDLNYDVKFSTYAVPLIAGEIRRFFRDDGMIKVSRKWKEEGYRVHQSVQQLTQDLGREPTLQEISHQTGFTVEEIALAENATASTESISKQTGEDGFSLEHILTDTESEEILVERISLRQAIERLPEREKKVICLRYFHGLTQERASKVLGVSQVQVSRIEKKALQSLRQLLR